MVQKRSSFPEPTATYLTIYIYIYHTNNKISRVCRMHTLILSSSPWQHFRMYLMNYIDHTHFSFFIIILIGRLHSHTHTCQVGVDPSYFLINHNLS